MDWCFGLRTRLNPTDRECVVFSDAPPGPEEVSSVLEAGRGARSASVDGRARQRKLTVRNVSFSNKRRRSWVEPVVGSGCSYPARSRTLRNTSYN